MITKDMTKGSVMKHILFFAIPLFLGNLIQQLYNVCDTMIAGYNLGDKAIASIGATSTMFSLINSFAFGLNGGYAIIVTQRFGAKDEEGFKKSVATMVRYNFVASLIITFLAITFLHPMMKFLNVPSDIYKDAYTYIVIIFAGLISAMTYNMLAGFLRSVGNSKVPLYFLIISCAINISMDCLLIMVFKIGVAGAALATVFAQICSCVFCGVYIWKKYKPLLPGREHFNAPKALRSEMLSQGFAMSFMMCIFGIGSFILQSAINGLETTIITAHTVARKVVEMFMQPLSPIGMALSTFVGQNWGAKKADRIREGIKKTILAEIAWGLGSAAIVWLFGRYIIIFMSGTSDPEVIKNAVMNIRINFVFFPILGILLSIRMAMQAMGQKIPPLFSSSLEMATKIIGAIWIVPAFKYLGASFLEPVSWLLCSALLGAIYLGTRKRNFARIEG